MIKFIKKLLGYCDYCNRYFKYPKRRIQNTIYEDNELNYVTTCKDCFDYIEECWEEQWKEYWSNTRL